MILTDIFSFLFTFFISAVGRLVQRHQETNLLPKVNADIERLNHNHHIMTFNPIIDEPRRTYRIKKKCEHNRYTPEMISFIKKHYSKAENTDEFAKLFNQRFSEAQRAVATLQAKANKLNLKRPNGSLRYSDQEIAFFHEHYLAAKTIADFHKAFNEAFNKKRSASALRMYANDRLGLQRRGQKWTRVNFTEAEVAYLIKHYPTAPNLRTFGSAFNKHFKSLRKMDTLSSKAKMLGLKRNK